jgi:DHA1 family quinolone resistance protein-like MFS transporter
MNRTIKLLMMSDVFVLTGFGLIDPILAIFIKDNLVGGTIFAAGMASTMFLLSKALVQLPFSRYVDKHEDSLFGLILGTFLIAIVPFVYIFADHIYYVYAAQIIHGIGCGLSYPTWLVLWTNHLDKKHKSFEWSTYHTLSGVGTAITASVGAAVAQYIGFTATFIVVGILSLLGCCFLIWLHFEHAKFHKGKRRQRF